jgi:hypothetical protein
MSILNVVRLSMAALALGAALGPSAALVFVTNRKASFTFDTNQYALELRARAHAQPVLQEAGAVRTIHRPPFVWRLQDGVLRKRPTPEAAGFRYGGRLAVDQNGAEAGTVHSATLSSLDKSQNPNSSMLFQTVL